MRCKIAGVQPKSCWHCGSSYGLWFSWSSSSREMDSCLCRHDRNGFELVRILGTALIDMYSKWEMPKRDVFAFTSMISGLANHAGVSLLLLRGLPSLLPFPPSVSPCLELKGACLLESGESEEFQVKMHDTIRDMALWITRGSSKSDKLLIINAFDGTSERLWYNAERICFMMSFSGDETQVPTLKSPNLLTLIHINTWKGDRSLVPQNFFEYMPNLRVLDLTFSEMKTFPTSITGLLELRYLSLSYTEINELPEELGKLVKLNYLDLSDMRYLEKIPSGVIGSLLELRVLDLFDSRGVDSDFGEVYKLKHLNDLAITIKTQHNLNKLLSNKNLQMCTRGLILQSVDEPFLFAYKKKKQSETLRLLEADMGIEQQQHLGSSCFQNLNQIEIRNCNGLKDLTWVGYVPNLKTLAVGFCKELEEIFVGVDDLGGSTGGGGDETILTTKMIRKVDIFKSLVNLLLWNLPKLKSICRNALAFPCLECIDVSRCPQLKKLPLDFGSNVNNTLQNITGGPKWWSELQLEEEEEDHNNNNNELLKFKFLPYFRKDSYMDVKG